MRARSRSLAIAARSMCVGCHRDRPSARCRPGGAPELVAPEFKRSAARRTASDRLSRRAFRIDQFPARGAKALLDFVLSSPRRAWVRPWAVAESHTAAASLPARQPARRRRRRRAAGPRAGCESSRSPPTGCSHHRRQDPSGGSRRLGQARGDAGGGGVAARDGQRFGHRVDAGDVPAMGGQVDGVGAGAAAQIQGTSRRVAARVLRPERPDRPAARLAATR